jgi:dephospho-CoA kinase
MGKSTAAKILAGFGLPVYNADHVVHGLLRKGGKGVKGVARHFPEAVKNGVVSRKILGRLVFGKPAQLRKLEGILHPLVWRVERDFIRDAKRAKAKAVVLEIPLLFETGGQKRCDFTLCVTAPKAVQMARVLRRKGMDKKRFRQIVARQMPDKDKRARADFVVKTGVSRADTKKQLRAILLKRVGLD